MKYWIGILSVVLGACGSDVPKDSSNNANTNNANNTNNTTNNAVNNTNNVTNNATNNVCVGNAYQSPCAGTWDACDGSPVSMFACVSDSELMCTCTVGGEVVATVTPTEAVNCSGELIHETANTLCGWELSSLSGL